MKKSEKEREKEREKKIVTYDGDYRITLTADQMVTLRYALARGAADLQDEALWMKAAKQDPLGSFAESARLARRLSVALDAAVREAAVDARLAP